MRDWLRWIGQAWTAGEAGGTTVSMRDDDPRLANYAEGYRMLAELGYRPMAPSDGHGNVVVPVEELDLDAEAMAYARDFRQMDDSMEWQAGCTHSDLAPAAVLVLEAFRLMNAGRIWGRAGGGGGPGDLLVPRLLRRAAQEYQEVVEEDRRRHP